MPSLTASVEASRLLRAERTTALAERLKAGDFDAARYESTPRRRAERLAEVLNRVVSRGSLRRRLRALGVSREFCSGDLLAISVEGGGLDVRRADGKGQVVTGPGLDAKLLAVFPELVPFTLRNLTFFAFRPGGGPNSVTLIWTVPEPRDIAGSGSEVYDLTLFLTSYTATFAEGRLFVDTAPNGGNPTGNNLTNATTTTAYATLFVADLAATGSNPYAEWKEFVGGANWVNTHAGNPNSEVGALGFSCHVEPLWNTTTASGGVISLRVTYTNTGCSTCSLDLQVNSDCDGNPVGGGTFDLGNGLTCTQDSGGTCTIGGIPHGTYDWTWTKTGYVSQSGTYVCECAGGPGTLFLSVAPTGGCDGTANVGMPVTDACSGSALSGVLIVLDEGTPDEQECTTDVSGLCTFTGVEAGSHTLTISKSGYQTQRRTFTTTGASGVEEVTITVSLVPDGGCDGVNPCQEPLSFGAAKDQGLRFADAFGLGLAFGSPKDQGLFFGPVEH